MPREFRHLVMTNIRRIAHSPADAKCIAGILHMQVILMCVAQAALKMWIAGRKVRRDPGVDVMPEEIPATATSETGVCELDSTTGSLIPFRTLWESVAGIGECYCAFPAGPVFSADSGQRC